METANEWSQIKRALCIRPDNLGDVVMTQPALRALKESFPQLQLMLLTSTIGAQVAKLIPEIDETIVFDVPWIKTPTANSGEKVLEIISILRDKCFDAAVICTNFSQNPLPSVMLAYLANIPLRLSYCRENPHQLLTNWVVDNEPFVPLKHGVSRMLELVATIGARTTNEAISLSLPQAARNSAQEIKKSLNITDKKTLVILHPGVSEPKRQFSSDAFARAANILTEKYSLQVLLTGTAGEQELLRRIQNIAPSSLLLPKEVSLAELASLIAQADVLISNNTGPVHLASGVQTPVVVLYARTNPEHTPWHVPSTILYFDVPKQLRSKNSLLYHLPQKKHTSPTTQDIVSATLPYVGITPTTTLSQEVTTWD